MPPMLEALWRLPAWANRKFERLLMEIEDLDPDSDEANAIRDEIRALPNFPRGATEHTMIRREITTLG